MEKAKLKWLSIIPPVWGDLECQFNPSELTIKKEITWTGEPSPSFNSPLFQYGGGEAATYDLDLFFDSYAAATSTQPPKDVREYTNQLLALTLRGHTAGVTALALLTTSGALVSGSLDKSLRVWA